MFWENAANGWTWTRRHQSDTMHVDSEGVQQLISQEQNQAAAGRPSAVNPITEGSKQQLNGEATEAPGPNAKNPLAEAGKQQHKDQATESQDPMPRIPSLKPASSSTRIKPQKLQDPMPRIPLLKPASSSTRIKPRSPRTRCQGSPR